SPPASRWRTAGWWDRRRHGIRNAIPDRWTAARPPGTPSSPRAAPRRAPAAAYSLLVDPVRPAAPDYAVGAGLEVRVDVVQMFDDVGDQAESGHYILAAGIDVLPAVDDHVLELMLGHLLERVDQRWGVGAAGSVRAVAAEAGLTV